MFGMGTIITSKQTVVPGGLWYGNPGKFSRNNIIGLSRHKIDDIKLNKEYQRYEAIRDERSKYIYDE
jgi:acyl-[acyl carrier protein]--UDP-N-acetylglucosamine O-acyltransferase